MTTAGVDTSTEWVADFAPGRLLWRPDALPDRVAEVWLAQLLVEVDWRQEHLRLFGKMQAVPRLVAWHGDPGAVYTYSGVGHEPAPWTPLLDQIRQWVSAVAGVQFNSVLLNLYRDGADGMGWHADDEPELGRDPTIASLSLGATRRMRFRNRRNHADVRALDLCNGSLLIMSGAIQHAWQHQISKTRRPVGQRINLTFRQVRPRALES